MKVRKLDRRDKGYAKVEWLLDYYEGPRRIRKWYKSKAQAEAAMDDLKSQHKQTGQSWLELSPEERNDVMGIYVEAKKAGITLRTVWEAYKTGKLDAAPMKRQTLKDALADTIRERTEQGRDERYVTDLKAFLGRFIAGRAEMPIDKIGKAEIEQWLGSQGWKSAHTYNSNLGRIGSMFDVAFRNGYITRSPMELVSTRTTVDKIPERLSVAEAETLLKAARKRKASLAYFALGLFAGLRPEELQSITWANVDLDAARVDMSGEQTKVNKHRFVPLEKTCVQWLKLAKKGSPNSICPPDITLRRHRRALRKALGDRWPQDVLRHTAASFLVQLHGNKDLVSKWLGNSVRELDAHYLSPVTDEDCKKFWALTPKGCK